MSLKKYFNRERKYSQKNGCTNLQCLKNEKKRLFSKMVLISRKEIDSLVDCIPVIENHDHFFEVQSCDNYSYFNSEDYDNNLLMIRGYASTALFFMKIIRSSGSKYVKSCYIAPCLYCFRHYVELILKVTLWYYSRYGYSIDISELNEEHNIVALWDKLLPLTGRKDEKTRNIGRLLHELSDIDKSGTTFRYSYHFTKKDRIQNEPLNMRIDNNKLYTRMLQIYHFLQGLNDEIEAGCGEMDYNNM